MKTAVIFPASGDVKLIDTPAPTLSNDNEVLVNIKAVAIKHLDKSRARGTHYSTENDLSTERMIGSDGVGTLEKGTRVYVINPKGTLAEQILVDKHYIVPIPENLNDATAAAIPNAVMGSAMALRFRAKMQSQETVLVNGATGITGKVAVQIAKIYGAKNIIVTGRNEVELEKLLQMGADEYLLTTDDNFVEKLKAFHQNSPIDIVLDYLWGKTAEQILEALKESGSFTPKTKFVSIGSLTGDTITLSSQILRSTDLQITGSGLGSWTKDEIQELLKQILPEMFQLAAQKKLSIETSTINLDDLETQWQNDLDSSKRLVIQL